MADEPNLEPAQTTTDDVVDATNADAADQTALTAETTSTDAAPSADQEGTAIDKEEGGGEDAGGDGDTVPETYADFTMPEGLTVDVAALEAATPIFKELGLTQVQAQKLVDLKAAEVQASARSQVDAFNQQKEDWLEQSKSDSDIGGDNFDKNIGLARSALDKFGTPELTKLMGDFGVGNHPEMIRFMTRVGALTAEDVPGGGDAARTAKDRVSIMYPT